MCSSDLQRLVHDLNRVYRDRAPLHEVDFNWTGFSWIEANDADNSVFSFVRYARDREDFIVVVCNFTPVVRSNYRIGVPRAAGYTELINSDLEIYGGGGVKNPEHIELIAEAWHNQEYSIALTLPPLAALILQPLRP